MLASLQNYPSKETDRARCLKRGGQGKEETLETLKPFLHPIDSETLPSDEQVADQLTLSVGAVRTLIHRLRKRYTALLRAEVARTVSDSGEIDEEIHALCDALIASEGRLV